MLPPRVNNLKLSHYRRDIMYEAILVDLYLMGALPKDVVEAFTGRKIPINLKPPMVLDTRDEEETVSES